MEFTLERISFARGGLLVRMDLIPVYDAGLGWMHAIGLDCAMRFAGTTA